MSRWTTGGNNARSRILGMPAAIAARLALIALVIAGVAVVSGAHGQSAAPAASQANADSNQNGTAGAASQKTGLVSILATVRDKKGDVVTDLTKSDFVLTEDGHPQDIQDFGRAVAQPITLGLLVDTSASQRQVLDEERTASRTFLEQMLREDRDKAFIIHFDHEVELLQDLTASHQKLEHALESLQAAQFNLSQENNPPDTGSGQRRGGRTSERRSHGGAQLYDAVYLASGELMKTQPGRKALVVLCNGMDRGSKETADEALETAQRADTIVYFVVLHGNEPYEGGDRRGGFGMGGPGMGGGGMGRRGGGRGYPQPQENRADNKKMLERMASQSGGRLFEVSKKLTVDQVYAQIKEDLRSQYSLGYTPARAGGASAGYHKIQLITKKKDLVVQTRDGYYSEPEP